MIDISNLEEAKKLIKKEKQPIIVRARDPLFNRKIIQYGKFNIILFPSRIKQKRSIRYIESGLDYISAREATKKGIIIAIDIQELSNLSLNEKAVALESLIQNIKILRKAKTKIKLINYKDKLDALNLLISLGASSQQAKESLNNKKSL